MDEQHARDHLKVGGRVAVYMGAGVAELTGAPPLVTTATVLDYAPGDTHVWLNLDIALGETLPQRYQVKELIGFLLPLAVVTHHEDGSVTGAFPPGTVTP